MKDVALPTLPNKELPGAAEEPLSSAEMVQGTVHHTTLLSDTVLLCVATWQDAQPLPSAGGHIQSDDASVAVRASLLHLPSEGTEPPISLIVLRLRTPMPAEGRWGTLSLGRSGRAIVLGPADLGRTVTDIRELLRASVTARGPTTRQRVVDFLVTAGIQRISRTASPGPQTTDLLHLIREALRERRQPSVIARDVPHALYVETLIRADSTGFYVRGWARDTAPATTRITAVSPEGMRVQLGAHLFRYPRPDLDDFYGSAPDRANDAGFLGFFHTPAPSTLSGGWIFEMEGADGSAIEFDAPALIEDHVTARDTVLADMFHDPRGTDVLLSEHLHPALSTLQQRHLRGAGIRQVRRFGTIPVKPEVSVIVPLYGRIDFVEQQMAQFVHDPAFRETDLIYVLDSPEMADQLLQVAAWLWPLYRVPFRVGIVDRNSGFAAANNMGASLAKGRLLLLLNSDVLPAAPGWLQTLVGFHDRTPRAGVVSPKLLYEDGSLQHAGLFFHFDELAQAWNNEHYFKGLHGSLPAANHPRQVPAVTAACMMISAQLYKRMGGLSGTYIQGDYEDSDLCLRLYQEGLGSWYLPTASLYHLEGQSYPSPMRQLTGRYNQWLHTRRWGDTIPKLMSALEPGAIMDGARRPPGQATGRRVGRSAVGAPADSKRSTAALGLRRAP